MNKPLKISVITLFPKFIDTYKSFGIVARAEKRKLLQLKSIDLRSFGIGPRKVVDDRPYGGGPGMVLRPDVVYKAIQKARSSKLKAVSSRVILLTPQGKPFNQAMAQRLAKYDNLILISGRYEGFDDRVSAFVDEEVSVGDYVLMGGELPALVISEAVIRLRPGVLGKDESSENESFSDGLLEYPQYTKPFEWKVKIAGKVKTLKVPEVLTTGNHAKVNDWRRDESVKRTKKRRPDLLNEAIHS